MCNRVGNSKSFVVAAGLLMSNKDFGGECDTNREAARCIRGFDGKI
jgi:hypothetical protein